MIKESKIIESYLIDLLLGTPKEDMPSDKYALAAIDMYKRILERFDLKEFINPRKPKVRNKPAYSNKTEPKTDVIFDNEKRNYKFSLKLDDTAYIVSCNSRDDFIKFMIDIHNGRNILDENTLLSLEKCADYIQKVPNFSSYDVSYMKDNRIEDFVRDKFYPKAIKSVNESKAKEYSDYIINCYKDKDKKSKYVSYLHEAESYIRNTITKLLIDYPEYSKKIIFEFLTGKIKFNKDHECVPDYLISNEGFFELSDHNCEYVNRMYNKYLSDKKYIRLQNVPRKNITGKILKSGDFDKIAETFSSADFTFKI